MKSVPNTRTSFALLYEAAQGTLFTLQERALRKRIKQGEMT